MKIGTELLRDFERWIKNQGKSENTVTTYRGVLQKFYQWLMESREKDISEVTKEDVQVYMKYLDEKQNRSASTIDKVFATIRVFAQFLEKIDIVENIQKKEKVKNIYQTTPKTLSYKEKINILNKVEQDGNLRNTAIVYTLLYTGIRISELCNLKPSDIEIKEHKGILIVRDSNEAKQRVIPLSKDVIFHLRQYIDSLKTERDSFFVSKDGHGLSTRVVQYMLQNYNINPIKLRHTFCQDLIDRGVDLATVARLAGHNDLNMTKRYRRSS